MPYLSEDKQFIEKTLPAKVRELLEVDGEDYKVVVDDVAVVHNNNRDDSRHDELKKTILRGRTWSDPIMADVRVVDKKTGFDHDKARIKVADLPRKTSFGTFVVDGTEYHTTGQVRLRAAPYTRVLDNGDHVSEFSTHHGKRFAIVLEPDRLRFRVRVGDSNSIYLYHLVKVLGVSDDSIKRAWGRRIYDINAGIPDANQIRNIFNQFVKGKYEKAPEKESELREKIIEYFATQADIDPEATQITLGKAATTVDGEVLLTASRKLIELHAGLREPDNRDMLPFKKYHSLEDQLMERLDRRKKAIQGSIRGRLNSQRKNVRQLVAPNMGIGKEIKSTFNRSQLQHSGETTNWLDIMSNDSKVTIMGEGGIRSTHTVKPWMRDLDPASIGFLDAVKTSAGEAGVSSHRSLGTRIKGDRMEVDAVDAKTGKKIKLDQMSMHSHVIAFPGEGEFRNGKYRSSKPLVTVIRRGKFDQVKADQVTAYYDDPRKLFSEVTNAIPFLNNNAGARAILGTAQATQAVPLVEREAPLVQAEAMKGVSFDKLLGEQSVVRSPVAGTVKRIGGGHITVSTKAGRLEKIPIMDNIPLEQGGFLHHTPKVQKGDVVKKGELLADSNFTQDGELAIGRNLRTAYMPYKGYTMEDGIVISESAAQKMTSEHMHTFRVKLDKNTELSRGKYSLDDPIPAKMAEKLDGNGLVRPGTTVVKGDILATLVSKNAADRDDLDISRVTSGRLSKDFKAAPILWEREAPGVVKDVVQNGSNLTITVKTQEPMGEADKFTNRHGGKGVVTLILPDEQMPQTADGKPLDIIVDPHGVPSRANVGQILELGAGKVAEKLGRPYLVDNFDGEDKAKKVMSDLSSNGLTDKEVVVDPETGREIPNVAVGREYFMKLRHQAESKMHAKTYDSPSFDIDRTPIKGQSVDLLTRYALMGHGATANLSEISTIKNAPNADIWTDIIEGKAVIPKPKIPFTTEKFEAMLKGMGINIQRDRTGKKLKLVPMTDKEVYDPANPHKSLSNGKIRGVDIVKNDNLEAITGGVFDPGVTGGTTGEKWSHIELPEPVLNPAFVPAVAAITGKSQSFIENLAMGKKEINGFTGGEGVRHLLSGVNVEGELTVAKRMAKNTSGDKRNMYNKKARALQALKDNGITAEDAYMMQNVPVPPPIYRPIKTLPDGTRMVSDVNYLYRDLALLSNQQWDRAITDKARGKIREDIYKEVKALTGQGDPPYEANYKGYSTLLFAGRGTGSAKTGFLQRKATRKRNTQTARSVITVNPDLDVDQIGLPKDMAWDIYKPFIIRRLVRNTRNMEGAVASFESRDQAATAALDAEMKARPVMANRAPSWHRYNVMAHWPTFSKGKNMEMPSLPIAPYYGGDFDGDAMQVHVPITRKAVQEAKDRTPAKLFWEHGRNRAMLGLSESAVVGFAAMAKKPEGKAIRFETKDAVVKAYHKGEIKPNQAIMVEGKATTPGIMIINDILPDDMDLIPGAKVMNKSEITKLMAIVAEKYPKDFPRIVNELNKEAVDAATYTGFSVGVSDLMIDDSNIQKMLGRMEAALPGMTASKRDNLFASTAEKIEKELQNLPEGNTFGQMLKLKSKGNATQIRQILGAPMVFKNASGKAVRVPVTNPFAKGMTPAQYHVQQVGGRGGLVQRSSTTARPGDKGKELLNLMDGYTLTSSDCGVTEGVTYVISDHNALDRYLARDHKGGAKKDMLVTPDMIMKMRKAGERKIEVRSPMKCLAKTGVCEKCYGLQEGGRKPMRGENVGVQDAQSVVDTSSALTLKAFHTTGAVDNSENKFDRYERLLNMPEQIPNQAPVATVKGTVQKVQKNAIGGWDVDIDGISHVVPQRLGLAPWVQKGKPLTPGTKLSQGGDVRVQDVLQYSGVEAARDHIATELGTLFDADKPGGINRRTMESIAANMVSAGHVADPGNSGFIAGDKVSLNRAMDYNRNHAEEIRLKDAFGRVLAEPVAGVDAGRPLLEDDLKRLKKAGVRKVTVGKNPIIVEPMIKALGQLPGAVNDGWIEKLESKGVKRLLFQDAMRGAESDIASGRSIPMMLYGDQSSTFGGIVD